MSTNIDPITITVTGPAHSGKTHVLAVIQNALEQAGIPNSNIVVQGCDIHPAAYMDIKNKVVKEGVPDPIKDRSIHLVEAYTHVRTK